MTPKPDDLFNHALYVARGLKALEHLYMEGAPDEELKKFYEHLTGPERSQLYTAMSDAIQYAVEKNVSTKELIEAHETLWKLGPQIRTLMDMDVPPCGPVDFRGRKDVKRVLESTEKLFKVLNILYERF